MLFFFFFQAEDGIRDLTVTGVQTCALPIFPYEVKTIRDLNLPPVLEEIGQRPRGLVLVTGVTGSGKSTALAAMINHINTNRRVNIIKIGRASCRERV